MIIGTALSKHHACGQMFETKTQKGLLDRIVIKGEKLLYDNPKRRNTWRYLAFAFTLTVKQNIRIFWHRLD